MDEQFRDPLVVGAEVEPPVGDAVRLVDDQQATAAQGGHRPGQEVGVSQAFGGDEQHVDSVPGEFVEDKVPVVAVGGVHGGGADPDALGGSDLIAHQREQG